MPLTLDGQTLAIENVVSVARGGEAVVLSDEARAEIVRVRTYIDRHWISDDAPPIYGFNTGVGKLKDLTIGQSDNDAFQLGIVLSHCGGIGDPAPVEVVRAMMLIRVNAFCQGVSGLRIEVVDRLVECLNKGVTPVVPLQGSVGASGDLAPLAHMLAGVIGLDEAECLLDGARMPAPRALAAAGILPVRFALKAKDCLACINGNALSAAIAALNVADAEMLMKVADATCALSLEAVRGELAAFDERIQMVRRQPGQVICAANIRRLVRNSERTSDAARRVRLPHDLMNPTYKPRVQDVYSLRCAPQVHGAGRDSLAHAKTVIERELNAATDNPLVFWTDEGELEFLSGGNFHCEPIALSMDLLAIAMAEITNISERRLFMLCDPALSYGLPPMLAGEPAGLNSGFPVISCSAAAIASENKALCFPASVDNIPTKSSQEDHVSMATWASRKARMVIENAAKVLGIEYLIGARAIFITRRHLDRFRLGQGTAAAYALLTGRVPFRDEDSYMPRLSSTALDLVRSGELLSAVETNVGALN